MEVIGNVESKRDEKRDNARFEAPINYAIGIIHRMEAK